MITPEQWKQIENQANKLYENLEIEIIQEIAERIANVGYANTVALNDVLMLQEMGVMYEHIIELVVKYNDTSASQIQEIFETAGVKSLEYDDKIYKLAGLDINPLKQSASMWQLLEATALKTHNNLNNLVMTTASSAQTQFYNAMNKAYLEVSTGVKSYSQSITDSIKEISKQGAYITYPSGQHRSIESAVRMNIITSVNQTCGKLQEMRADELGWDLMELTAHAGARPEHAEWQGRIVSRSGQKGYLSLEDIGYGEATGFKGVNCRHDWRPYYKGSSLTYSNNELKEMKNATVNYNGKDIPQYQAEQMQRAIERKIRQDKKDIAGLQGILTSSNKDDKMLEEAKTQLINAQGKLKQHNSILSNFAQQTGLKKDYTKLQIASNTKQDKLGNSNKDSIGGSGKGKFVEKIQKSQLRNKIKEYENDIRDMSIEYGVLIDKNNNVYAYSGDKTNLKITDRDLDNVILTHNHPEVGSFGKDDFELLRNNSKIKELRAVDNEYDYSLKILKDLDMTYNEIYIEGSQLAFEIGDEIQHCIMKILEEKGYIKYERRRKK